MPPFIFINLKGMYPYIIGTECVNEDMPDDKGKVVPVFN
jgi:hypothetical protein